MNGTNAKVPVNFKLLDPTSSAEIDNSHKLMMLRKARLQRSMSNTSRITQSYSTNANFSSNVANSITLSQGLSNTSRTPQSSQNPTPRSDSKLDGDADNIKNSRGLPVTHPARSKYLNDKYYISTNIKAQPLKTFQNDFDRLGLTPRGDRFGKVMLKKGDRISQYKLGDNDNHGSPKGGGNQNGNDDGNVNDVDLSKGLDMSFTQYVGENQDGFEKGSQKMEIDDIIPLIQYDKDNKQYYYTVNWNSGYQSSDATVTSADSSDESLEQTQRQIRINIDIFESNANESSSNDNSNTTRILQFLNHHTGELLGSKNGTAITVLPNLSDHSQIVGLGSNIGNSIGQSPNISMVSNPSHLITPRSGIMNNIKVSQNQNLGTNDDKKIVRKDPYQYSEQIFLDRSKDPNYGLKYIPFSFKKSLVKGIESAQLLKTLIIEQSEGHVTKGNYLIRVKSESDSDGNTNNSSIAGSTATAQNQLPMKKTMSIKDVYEKNGTVKAFTDAKNPAILSCVAALWSRNSKARLIVSDSKQKIVSVLCQTHSNRFVIHSTVPSYEGQKGSDSQGSTKLYRLAAVTMTTGKKVSDGNTKSITKPITIVYCPFDRDINSNSSPNPGPVFQLELHPQNTKFANKTPHYVKFIGGAISNRELCSKHDLFYVPFETNAYRELALSNGIWNVALFSNNLNQNSGPKSPIATELNIVEKGLDPISMCLFWICVEQLTGLGMGVDSN